MDFCLVMLFNLHILFYNSSREPHTELHDLTLSNLHILFHNIARNPPLK